MTQRRRTIKCRVGEKRFTVVRVNGDPYDTHAGRSFEQAMSTATPDRGSTVEVFAVCGKDPGAVRLPSEYERRGQLLRTFKAKGGR
jgi:hypothetical protein